MDKQFLIDTNIIIYYTDGQIPANHYERVSDIFRNSFYISTITKIEVLGWHKLVGEEKIKLEAFLKNATVFYVDEQIQQKAIDIKQSKRIASPDAIIGATAFLNEFILVTRNEKDFIGTNIEIYNPFKEIDENK